MPAKRLFIAIDLPWDIKRKISKTCEGIKKNCWTNSNQLHLTLAFLGNVDTESITTFEEKLEAVQFSSFDLIMDRALFTRSKLFWLRAIESKGLLLLKRQIDAAVLESLELAPSQKAFLPHITLARFKRGIPVDKSKTLKAFEKILPQRFPVKEFTLFESKTYSSGAVHKVVRKYNSKK